MKNGYLKKSVGVLVLLFAFCSVVEAGSSASKVYRMSVTVPARTYLQANAESSLTGQNQEMQLATEKDIRDSQVVMVKTAVIK